MVKLVYVVRKRPDLTDEEFRRYWLENHGPLVKSVAQVLGARRYVQSHTLDSPLNVVAQQPRGSKDAYDGLTELWWDDHDQLLAVLQTPEAQEAHKTLVEDEARFCDLPNCSLYVTEEHIIFES